MTEPAIGTSPGSGRFTCPAGLHQRFDKFTETKPCRPCVAAERLAADTELVAGQTGVDADVVAALITTVASKPQQFVQLHDWLHAADDPLQSGSSAAPQVAQRFLAEFARAGADVALPTCRRCGRVRPLVALVEDGRVCFNCYHAGRPEPCAHCGRTRRVVTRTAQGAAVCQSCRAADPATWQPCGRCGTVTQTVIVIDGIRVGRCCYVQPGLRCSVCGHAKGERPWRTRRPVCTECAARPRTACVECGLDAAIPEAGQPARCYRCSTGATATCRACGLATVNRDSTGQPRCVDCYQRPTRPCGRCGRDRPIVRLATDDTPELCGLCWRGPVVACDSCGQVRACRGERSGAMLCLTCQRAHRNERQPCNFCQQVRPVFAHWPDGPVCASCYVRHRAIRGTCPVCRRHGRLVRTSRREPTCGKCLQLDGGVCGRCGADDEPLWDRGRCPRCTLADRLDRLLGDPDTRSARGLADLYQAVASAPSPRAVLDWFRTSPSSRQLLARIGAGELDATHEALDQLEPSGTVEHLRHLLVATGVLPSRDPVLAKLERWINEHIDHVDDADHAKLLRLYVRWKILPSIRAKAEHGPLTDATGYGGRQRLRSAARFLEHLATAGVTPDTCRQTDIDTWLTTQRSHYTGPTRAFVLWAIRRGALPRLDYPATPTNRRPLGVTDDQRWDTARRLLHDPDIALVDRVAGALVVIYAQPLTRISHLTTHDITLGEERVTITLGRSPIDLPEPLASHVRQLVNERPGPTTVRLDTDWLFPSRAAKGRPTGATAIGERLARLGITPSQHRQAALLQLCAEIPAVVTADLLGVSIHTAETWAHLAGRDQADYLELLKTGP